MKSPLKVLITGATSPIGSFLAAHYAGQKCELYLHGRNAAKLAALKRRLGSAKATVLVADYTDEAAMAALFSSLRAQTKSIDVLINNAFGKLEVPLKETTSAGVSEFFQVSVAGTANMIRGCLPFLKRGTDPRVINIVADWGFPMHNIMTGTAPYIAGKYAVHGLGAALQTELGAMGIRTTSLCPGIVAADAPLGISDKKFDSKYGRNAISPAEIAGAIDFVLSQRTSHVRSVVLSPRKGDYNGL